MALLQARLCMLLTDLRLEVFRLDIVLPHQLPEGATILSRGLRCAVDVAAVGKQQRRDVRLFELRDDQPFELLERGPVCRLLRVG